MHQDYFKQIQENMIKSYTENTLINQDILEKSNVSFINFMKVLFNWNKENK